MTAISRPFEPITRDELLVAGVTAVVGVSISFAVYGPTTDFVVTPVNTLVVDRTPGRIVVTAIRYLGTWSEALAFTVALAGTVGWFGVAALVGRRLGGLSGDRFGVLLGVYFAGWVSSVVVLAAPVTALPPAIAMAGAVGVDEYWPRGADDRQLSLHRRRVTKIVAALLGTVGLSTAVGLRRTPVETAPVSAISASERRTIERRLHTAAERSLDVDGMPGLVSRTAEYYEVDVDTINPDVSVTDWSLTLTGAVETDRSLSYHDLVAKSPSHRFATLRCVGDPLNGQLVDNALWTGVPIRRLLDPATPHGTHVMLRAVDGYYEEFPLEALSEGFLAYGMNGQLLPRNHGYPVRALVPGHWGEINVKWLTEIHVLDRERQGYWERRGWHGTGPVNTVAKLWAVNRLEDGKVQIGGLAYAGTRGIQRVEVSLDGGATWQQATLSDPLPGDDVWRQWRYEWTPSRERYEVVVRAVDGDGTRQPREREQPFPQGATGWVSETIRP